MKIFASLGWLLIALGVAGLLSGCASNRATKSTQRVTAASDFEVVETSTKRQLTATEMEKLHVAVAEFLEKQGAVASGDYYVKVYLTPDQGGVPSDWVIVRFTRDTELRFSLLASYPAYSYGYQSYAAYDYYPYGYNSFGRISFHYYDDPFYGSRYYYPPRYHRGPSHHHDGNQGKDHDEQSKPGSGHAGYNDGPSKNAAPGAPPVHANRIPGGNNSPDGSNQPREQDNPSRNRAPRRQTEGVQAAGNNSTPAGVISPRTGRPAPATYTPPADHRPASRNLAPAGAEAQERHSQPRGQNYPSRNESPRPRPESRPADNSSSTPPPAVSTRNERSSPTTFSPPAPRPEPRDHPSVDRGPRESRRTAPDSARFDN